MYGSFSFLKIVIVVGQLRRLEAPPQVQSTCERTKGSLAPCLVAARSPGWVCWRPRLAGTRQYITLGKPITFSNFTHKLNMADQHVTAVKSVQPGWKYKRHVTANIIVRIGDKHTCTKLIITELDHNVQQKYCIT